MRAAVLKWGAYVLLAIALTGVNYWWCHSVNGIIVEVPPGDYIVIPPFKV